ncbi:NAD-dependent epimerase/dehydratase family protein [Nocardiopsis protaetiae]|uniref:NAD-dependent epimerase/dehydratase family protein n=1 Tax=Nocardiopsis protaetiae TaxID=3382270 RepID=UPI00387A97B8
MPEEGNGSALDMATSSTSSAEPPGRSVVTGASGFLGSHLTGRLIRDGGQVLGIDKAPMMFAAGTGFSFRRCDLATDDLVPVLRGADTVFHLAGMSGVRESWGDRFADYVHANILGTQRLLEACRTAGVRRFVIASSSSVYGPVAGRPSLVDDLPRPVSPYGVSKLAAERLALAYAEQPHTDFDVCVLRYFTVYGPRQRPTMLMARVLEAAHTGRPLTVFGQGTQWRHFTYVDDAVEATVLAGTRPLPGSRVVNVAGPRSVSVAEVLDTAASVVGSPVPVRYEAERPGDVSASETDPETAFASLGYRPRTDLVDGLIAHWEWYRTTVGRSAARPTLPMAFSGGTR